MKSWLQYNEFIISKVLGSRSIFEGRRNAVSRPNKNTFNRKAKLKSGNSEQPLEFLRQYIMLLGTQTRAPPSLRQLGLAQSHNKRHA